MSGSSVYEPYYSRIQELLFDGMEVKEVHEYMKVFFSIYADYLTLLSFCKMNNLKWCLKYGNGRKVKRMRWTRKRVQAQISLKNRIKGEEL